MTENVRMPFLLKKMVKKNILVILKTKQILNREANNAAYRRKPFLKKS